MKDAEDGQTVALPTPPEDVYAVCPIMHQNPQHLQIEFVGDQQTPMLAVSPDETTMKVLACLEQSGRVAAASILPAMVSNKDPGIQSAVEAAAPPQLYPMFKEHDLTGMP